VVRRNLVASSLGAAYAVCVAEEHPELVNALILNSPAGYDTLNTRPGNVGSCVLRIASVSGAWNFVLQRDGK
jgi:pimeloyl-ACP methyl ester carboxylesterase